MAYPSHRSHLPDQYGKSFLIRSLNDWDLIHATRKSIVIDLGAPSSTYLYSHHDLMKSVEGLMTCQLDRLISSPAYSNLVKSMGASS